MLNAALDELGWSKARLARKLGVHVNTVTKWGDEPPEYARAYLEAVVSKKRLRDELDAELADTQPDGRGKVPLRDRKRRRPAE